MSPFRLPRYRSLRAELATARAFLEEASSRHAAFESFGPPPTFIGDFRALVRQPQEASDVRLSSKTVRRRASGGGAALRSGGDAPRAPEGVVSARRRRRSSEVHVFRSARMGRWLMRTFTTTERSYRTQAQAARAGMREAKRRRVDLVIHGRKGRIRSKDSYGNETPRLDREH